MEDLNKNGLSKRLEQLDAALSWAEDTISRAQIPFMLLGNTAKSVIDNEQVEGDKIELGIRKNHLTKDTLGMLRLMVPDAEVKDGKITIDYNGLPIEIKIIAKNYQVLKYPSQVWYKVTEYFVPNPFSGYWRIRNLIR